MKLLLGDSVDKLKELDDNSIDSIVTDPPYGLSFMGKKWDYDVPSQEIFEECLRVLKPGGYLLSFAGSRTYHRMAVRVEDAGFEIRDQIMWIYGSGFPKSMNIGKAMDKVQGNEREVVGKKGGKIDFSKTKKGDTSFYETAWDNKDYVELEITKGNSEWEGWGTALKPAHEPIVMARKPLSEKTVVNNVLEWGTGGINIDESRIGTTTKTNAGKANKENNRIAANGGYVNDVSSQEHNYGRFPANIILDKEAGRILDEQTGELSTVGSPKKIDNSKTSIFGAGVPGFQMYGDKGGASRFFYCPKTSKTDRNEGLDEFEDKYYAAGNQAKAELKRGNVEFNSNKGKGKDERHNHNQVGVSKNNHPTVKPTDLMLYLIRLITPKGGTTLDPFMGSGSTGKAAVRGGFDFVGIEREKEYMEIAEARIQYEKDNPYSEEKEERIQINKNANKFF
jgi:site-specific DNA-methyltransferase (adenine-specific)